MCLNSIVVKVTVTSEDVCWSIRNVKFINESFYNMRCLVMFITAVCLIFLLKLKWPKNKSELWVVRQFNLEIFCFNEYGDNDETMTLYTNETNYSEDTQTMNF